VPRPTLRPQPSTGKRQAPPVPPRAGRVADRRRPDALEALPRRRRDRVPRQAEQGRRARARAGRGASAAIRARIGPPVVPSSTSAMTTGRAAELAGATGRPRSNSLHLSRRL